MDTSNWLTIIEASKISGISTRTIERKIEKHLITTARRQEQGKKPEIVLPPDEVEALKTKLRPTVQTKPTSGTPDKPPRRQPDMRALLKALENLRMPIMQKLFLTDKEAAMYLGFSKAEVRRLTDQGVIPSFRTTNRQRMIARKDVETYVPTNRQLTAWRNGEAKQVELQ